MSLMHLILQNSDYADHQHRRAQLEHCFEAIQNEEGHESELDRLIVIQIWNDFPQYFGSVV